MKNIRPALCVSPVLAGIFGILAAALLLSGCTVQASNPGKALSQSSMLLSNGVHVGLEALLVPHPDNLANCTPAPLVTNPGGLPTLTGPEPFDAGDSNCAYLDFDIPPQQITGISVNMNCKFGNAPYECNTFLIDRTQQIMLAQEGFKAVGWVSRPAKLSPFRGPTSGHLRLLVYAFSTPLSETSPDR